MTTLARHFESVAITRGRCLIAALLACVGLFTEGAAYAQFSAYGYEWLYAGPRGTTVVAPPAGPGRLDPFAVWARFGFWPNPYIARQPIGHQTIATGPNGYIYRPVYADDETAASVALPRAADAWASSTVAPPRPAPATPETLRQAAWALFRAADYEGALDGLERLLQTDPDDELARLLAVQAHFALGDYRAAVDVLSAALDAAPEHEWNHYLRDYRQSFGSALRYLGHLRALERFVAARPNRTDARLLLAYEYGCLGFTDRALALLDRLHGDLAQRLREYFDDEPPAPALDEDDVPAPPADEGAKRAPARPRRREF